LACDDFESVVGQGLRSRNNGKVRLLGRRDLLAAEQAQHRESIQRVPATEAGFSGVLLAEGEPLCPILLPDHIPSQARGVLESLRGEGLRTVVLTGDRRATAEHLRTQLQLDDLRAELKPEQKLSEIRKMIDAGQRVAMVGDGVNDAPSLAAAHIGVAM